MSTMECTQDMSLVASELVEEGRVTGWLDRFHPVEGKLHLKGWALHPTQPIDGIQMLVNDVEVSRGPVLVREKVGMCHREIPHAARCGFEDIVPLPDGLAPGKLAVVRAVCFGGGRKIGEYRAGNIWQEDTDPAPPPETLMKRVSGTDNAWAFAQMGLNAAIDLMAAAQKHLGLPCVRRVLDYGCGSGRVASYLMKLWPQIELHGCDIDSEAIVWCNAHLKAGGFKTMQTVPPLPYRDRMFDVVAAVSVMTHLTLQEQHRWLAEVRRVVRPGGLFLATIHGAFAAHFHPEFIPILAEKGIADEMRDPALGSVAPDGYYRSTFQLPSFTRREWSRHWEVVEIIQGGGGGFQDLVVLRRH